MRSLFIIFLAMPLAGFAMTLDTSKDAPTVQDVCTSAQCEQGNPPSAIESRTPEKSGAEDNAPIADIDGPVEAKGGGGHGGGGGRGGGGKKGGGVVVVGSSGTSKAVANPLSVLRGPILFLNSILPTARAQTSLRKSPAAAGGSGFVAEARIGNAAGHEPESVKHRLPRLRRDGCDAMLGFDCGSASKADIGPVGRLVKWVRSA